MQSNADVNPLLTDLSNNFASQQPNFIARQLFPVFNSGLQSAAYYVYDRENLMRLPRSIRRAPGSGYSRSQMKLSDDSFNCVEYGHEEPVDDTERAKYANSFSADEAATERGTEIVLGNLETRVRDLSLSAAVPGSGALTNKWDDYTNGTPIADVNAARAAVHAQCGLEANTLVINRDVLDVLAEHPAILDKYKHTQTGVIFEDMLARVFKVDRVLVGRAVADTAQEGQALSPGLIWPDTAIVAHVNASQSLRTPNFGRVFSWSQFGGSQGLMVETYRESKIKSDVHRASQICDEKLVGAFCGYRIEDVLA